MRAIIGSLLLAASLQANAYYLGGMYAQLVSCQWGQYGYKFGNIGTYQGSDGKYYLVFFGSSWCEY